MTRRLALAALIVLAPVSTPFDARAACCDAGFGERRSTKRSSAAMRGSGTASPSS
jgi:hypothetical protein